MDRSWFLRAACRDKAPLMDPPDTVPSNASLRTAWNVCRTCPVIAECAQTARLTKEPLGWWGGRLYMANGLWPVCHTCSSPLSSGGVCLECGRKHGRAPVRTW
jgi:hypothetical protein